MTNIEEAISYIESTEKHLRHLGESWYADFLSDAIDLLKDQKKTEPNYKKYISVEWLKQYTKTFCAAGVYAEALSLIDTWMKYHEICCCEKKDIVGESDE